MPRDGSGVYSKPAGSTATTGDVALAATHNNPIDDLVTDANTARPVVAGGTGAATALAARANLGVSGVIIDKSGAYTALAADRAKLIRGTASFTLSLTAAATLGDGWFVDVLATTGTITIDPNGSETIDGATTLAITVGQSARIRCNGTAFYSQFLAVGAAPVFTTIELGNASDTTLSRVSAGVVAVEGDTVATLTATQTMSNKTIASPAITGTPTVTSTDAGSGLGPLLILHRDSASPAASDNLGSVQFRGEDAASNVTIYAMAYGFITDTTDGAERGGLAIQTMQSGTLTDALVVDSQGKVGLGSSVPSAYQSAYNDLVVGRASEASGGIVIVGSSVSTLQFVDNISGAETRDALIQMDHVLDRLSLNADAATPLLNLFGAASAYAGNVGIGTSTPAVKLDVSGGVKIGTTTVAGLPAAAAAGAGARYFVSDGTAAAFRTVVVGGGSVFLPVYSDGTDWRIG